MGGLGSGRRQSYNTRPTTEDYFALDIRNWNRKGLIKPNKSFIWRWSQGVHVLGEIGVKVASESLIYVICGLKENSPILSIKLSWSACTYGGKRAWFICPREGCNNRIAILYGTRLFACRRCLQLPYMCQSESEIWRSERQADKIRVKLGWSDLGLIDSDPRPKGMHRNSYNRLLSEYYKHRLVSGMFLSSTIQNMGQNNE